MNDENGLPTDTLTEIIREQIASLLVYLSRPSVQRQLLAIILILVLVVFVPELVRRWINRRYPGRDDSRYHWRRWVKQLYRLFAPVVGLIFIQVVIWLFTRLGYPHGLLEKSRFMLWLWLGYRALMLVLFARFGDGVRPYDRWVFSPIFMVLVLLEIVNSYVGPALLGGVPLLVVGDKTVFLGNVVLALALLYIFVVLSWIIEKLLNRNLPGRLNVEPGVIQSVTTLIRYAIISLGMLASLYAIGLNLTSLAIVAGGLSVGIGIGLQDVIGNFISGLMLLFEQSLRPGDVIEIDGQASEVKKVSIRSTTVLNRDNVEVIIPNATFTNQQVTTFTKTDRLVRIRMPFGVSYESDPLEVRHIAEETAGRHSLILKTPKPTLLFYGFGDSSLDFELAVWTSEPEQRQLIRSDLYYMLWSSFKISGIEIPFPQRDLNLKRGWKELTMDLGKADNSVDASADGGQ